MIVYDKANDMRVWAREVERELRELRQMVMGIYGKPQGGVPDRIMLSPADLRESMKFDLTANTALTRGDVRRVLIVNCTSASDLNLPSAQFGDWVWIVNIGTTDITLKTSGGTTIVTIRPDHAVFAQPYDDGSANPEWPTKIETVGNTGREWRETRIIWGAEGPVVKDSGGTYWEIGVSTLGALTTTNLGSTIGGLD